MAATLLVYSTVDGQTRRISERIAERLAAAGRETVITPVETCGADTLASADRVVVGASIRYGKYRPNLLAFVRERADELNRRPSAFFTVNLVARKPGRDTPETNPYVAKLLDETSWRPGQIGIFAGKLDYPRYGWRDRQIIRLIMWMTGGPTDPRSSHDFTDWARVDAFADRVASLG